MFKSFMKYLTGIDIFLLLHKWIVIYTSNGLSLHMKNTLCLFLYMHIPVYALVCTVYTFHSIRTSSNSQVGKLTLSEKTVLQSDSGKFEFEEIHCTFNCLIFPSKMLWNGQDIFYVCSIHHYKGLDKFNMYL